MENCGRFGEKKVLLFWGTYWQFRLSWFFIRFLKSIKCMNMGFFFLNTVFNHDKTNYGEMYI